MKTSYEIAVKAATWCIILDQIRKQATDEADIQLTESIRQHGILQPLGAKPDGKLIWGHRRLRCGLAAGLKEFPVVILHKDMTESEYVTLQIIENSQRESLSPWDMAMGCVRLMEANPTWQAQDLSKALSISPSMVTRWLAITKVSAEWKEALKAGKVGISDVYAASKLSSEAEMSGLLALKLSGASRDQIETAARKTRKPSAPAVKVAKVKCQLPSGYTVVVSGEGVSLEDATDALSDAIKEMKRARDLGYTAKTFAAAMADRSRKA